MEKRLFLLDGMALVYRAHFAFAKRPILTSAGFNTSALYGFTNTLLEIQNKHQPTHLAVALDTPEPTARHLEYPAYKAQREAMPEDLSAALPHVERLCAAFRISTVKCPGYEADDIVGTLSRRAEPEGFETFMVTPDKDFAQLVSDSTYLFKPGRKGDEVAIMGLPDVLEEWGIERAEQVIDILGLWGDVSDNIPGVPGIGQKTASKLILKYGSIENLLEHADDLKGKQKENLRRHRDSAALSKRLATIDREVPLSIGLGDLECQPQNADLLRQLCVEFEFNSIGRRLFGAGFKAGRGGGEVTAGEAEGAGKGGGAEEITEQAQAKLQTLADVEHEYVCVQTESARKDLAAQLEKQRLFCFDTETTGLDAKSAMIIGLAFAFESHRAFYVPVVAYDEQGQAVAGGEVDLAVLKDFRGVLENPSIEKIGHNLKYDLSVLRWHGLAVRGTIWDTMLMHCLIEPELRHGMDFLAEKYLRYSPVSISKLIGERGGEQQTMLAVGVDQLAEYAAEDADVTWRLYQELRPRLKETEQESVYFDIEEPLIRVLVAMEYEGVRLDSDALQQFSVQLGEQIQLLERAIYNLAGTEFNLNSPKQLGEVLFGQMKLIEKPKKTKTGQYATNEQVLMTLASEHEIVRKILDYRTATKLKSTYADALPGSIFKATGRVHTTYHQAATATGRLNSQNPNLQNIPIRTELGQEIRRAFVPRGEGYELMSADYSQIELRIIASLSGDEGMKAAFTNGDDIHTATAAKVFGVSLEMVTAEMRRKAKMVNFGVAYGISAFGLSQRLGIPRKEASKIIEQFFESFPGVKKYIDKRIEFARKHGYVQTVSGRRRYLRDINSKNGTVRRAAERNAINSPIQGTAADLIKRAMARIGRAIEDRGLRTRLLLQVHDELIFDLWAAEAAEAKELVADAMKNALTLSVPLEVEIGTGRHWLEAH
ncbi:MAG: DNA polymerase I [Verrucomicrobia subdivision 3 bacterium]|nr:DNA polymerase I [Limisphaerales bacterium]MCS1413776.1 DNA polymerase I [Limisphaerales bacterium]